MSPTEAVPIDLSSLTEPEPVLTPKTLGGLKVTPVAERINFLNMLLYGNSGVGKTRLSASAFDVPEMSPVLFVDIEGGTFSIRDLYPTIDVVRVQSWKEMQAVYDELRRGMKYKTIVLDSLTEIQKFSMYTIMLEVVSKEPDRDPDVPSIREWGKNGEQTRKLVRAFRDLPCNTIFTALASHDRNPKTGKNVTTPSLSGKLKAEVAGFLDIVSYYYIKELDGKMTRCLLTAATEEQVAKDRSDNLPDVIIAPSMQTIHNYVFQTETENK